MYVTVDCVELLIGRSWKSIEVDLQQPTSSTLRISLETASILM